MTQTHLAEGYLLMTGEDASVMNVNYLLIISVGRNVDRGNTSHHGQRPCGAQRDLHT